MYQPRVPQQQIVPVSFESPKMRQVPLSLNDPRAPPTTFMQHSLPIPTQIQQQQRVQIRQIQSPEAPSLVQQVQQQQRQRQMRQQSPPTLEKIKQQSVSQPTAPWMGEDVYLVAFLLGVELQRLREENEQLYNEKEQMESKARAINVIDNELREARNKIGEYEKKLALMHNELESWRQKYGTREREIEDIFKHQEIQHRTQLEKEIRELTQKYLIDRNNLETEIKRLRYELEELRRKNQNIDDIIHSAEYIQNENMWLRKELEHIKQEFDQLKFVYQTAAELEYTHEDLKAQLNAQEQKQYESHHLQLSKHAERQVIPQQTFGRETNSIPSPNATPNPNANVNQLQKELMMIEAENRRLREQLKPYNKRDDAFCY